MPVDPSDNANKESSPLLENDDVSCDNSNNRLFLNSEKFRWSTRTLFTSLFSPSLKLAFAVLVLLILLCAVVFSESTTIDEAPRRARGVAAVHFLAKPKKTQLCKSLAGKIYSESGIVLFNNGESSLINDFTWAIMNIDDDNDGGDNNNNNKHATFKYYFSSIHSAPSLNDTVFLDYGFLKISNPESTYGPNQHCELIFESNTYSYDNNQWVVANQALLGSSWDERNWIIVSAAPQNMDDKGLLQATFHAVISPIQGKKTCKHRSKKLEEVFSEKNIDIQDDLSKLCIQ